MGFTDDIFSQQSHKSRDELGRAREHADPDQSPPIRQHRQWMGDLPGGHDTGQTDHHRQAAFNDPSHLLRALIQNKTWLVLLGLTLLIVLGLVVAAAIFMLPMAGRLLETVGINNWQGLLDQGLVMLQKMLAGGKGT
jgi:hypothetical protein